MSKCKKGGILFGQDPEAAAKVCEAVKKNAKDKTVIIKLSPSVQDIRHIAKTVEKAGADAVSLINTIPAMAVDIYSRRPKLTNVISGVSGPAIKPIALKMVFDMPQSVDIPVIGIRGISNVEDVFEFILVGAHAGQIGSANFRNSKVSFEIVNKLKNVAKKLNINKISDVRSTLKKQL